MRIQRMPDYREKSNVLYWEGNESIRGEVTDLCVYFLLHYSYQIELPYSTFAFHLQFEDIMFFRLSSTKSN